MDPSNSDEAFEVSSVFHSFRLAWKIPLNIILSDRHEPRNVSLPKPFTPTPPEIPVEINTKLVPVKKKKRIHFPYGFYHPTTIENSKLYVFEDLKLHPFYLKLTCSNIGEKSYNLRIVSKDPNQSIHLNYAFVTYEDQQYYLADKEHSILWYIKGPRLTRPVLEHISLKEKYIIVMCQVTAECDVHFTSPEQVSKTAKESEALILKCSFLENENTHFCLNYLSSTCFKAHEAVCKYLASGEIPNLNVDLAQKILEVSVEENIAELKARSVEHLMKNLDPENIVRVWTFACERGLVALVKACSQYMIKNCKVIENKE